MVVLDVFCVLTMSMVYYYGQLQLGHGFYETAENFVASPNVKRLRHAALDAFWASAPLFMIAMGLTAAARYPASGDEALSGHVLAVAVVFGGGAVLLIFSILSVLMAHKHELHYHYHPEDRPNSSPSTSRGAGKRDNSKHSVRDISSRRTGGFDEPGGPGGIMSTISSTGTEPPPSVRRRNSSLQKKRSSSSGQPIYTSNTMGGGMGMMVGTPLTTPQQGRKASGACGGTSTSTSSCI